MKLIKRIMSAVAAAVCFTAIVKFDEYRLDVTAANNLIFDYSEIKKNPYHQFYYSDQEEFFRDGIKVSFDGNDVTADTVITFYTTPKTTYNGKSTDYIVPFIAEYDGKAAEGQLDVKIGMRGDVNLDHKITANDLVIIQNDLLQTYTAGKTTLSDFGIFLGNADGRQSADTTLKQYGKNLFNIGDAFFVSSYLNGKGKSMYDNILLNNAIKTSEGVIYLSDAIGKVGETVTIPVTMTAKKGIGAFDFTCKWNDNDLIPIGVTAVNSDVSVFSAFKDNTLKIWGFGKKDVVKSGEILYITFKISDNMLIDNKCNVTIGNVNYFGAGENISQYVLTYDGVITANGIADVYADVDAENYDGVSYDYGIKAWDVAVEPGTTSAEIPVMLLGGLETKSLKLTVQCDAPLSVSSLNNAFSISGNSKEGLIGSYDSDDNLPIDFETIKIAIDKNAEAGRYPIKISVEEIVGVDETAKISTFNGSVTVKGEPVIKGDANNDGKLNVRDCAFIASKLSIGKTNELLKQSDYNVDGKINVRDAAAIAKKLSGA